MKFKLKKVKCVFDKLELSENIMAERKLKSKNQKVRKPIFTLQQEYTEKLPRPFGFE